jgi:ribosomal protein S6--L-glutamate ligase
MKDDSLHLCFIVEEQYRRSRLPMAVVDQLVQWNHNCVILEPHAAIASISDLIGDREFDAIVLRTLSSGPGLSLLQALAACGVVTINNAEAVHRVRDKVVVAAIARARGIPFPDTFFLAHAGLLQQVPSRHFPLVVKPSSGGLGQGVRLIHEAQEAKSLDSNGTGHHWVAQPWISNPGYDIKLYNTGRSLHAVRRRSSLLGGADREREVVPITAELRALTLHIGEAYGLDIYGADVVESAKGWVVVDVNDFPSFKMISEAPELLATSIVDIARGHRLTGP